MIKLLGSRFQDLVFRNVVKVLYLLLFLMLLCVLAPVVVVRYCLPNSNINKITFNNIQKPMSEKLLQLDEKVDYEKCKDLLHRVKQFESYKNGNIANVFYTNGDQYIGGVISQNETINSVSRFVGVTSSNLPHGWGRMDYKTGSRYTGQWSNGVREGCGVMLAKGKISSLYYGEWQQDRQTGWGRIEYSLGAKYRGNWVNNQYHGPGVLTWSNNDSFSGFFSYGAMHGVGRYYYSSDGSRYFGEWTHGKTNGEGYLLTARKKCFRIVWNKTEPNVYTSQNCEQFH